MCSSCFSSRGGRLTVFSQRSPRAVRAVLGGLRLAAPALTCGGTLAYRFSEGSGQPLCSFAGCEESIFKKLPAAVGLGIALQMADGSTRVLRMSTALERHLRREFTPFTLCSPADVKGADVLRILLYQDRVLNGEVVDYINLLFMQFAVFNFADICVCVGVGLWVLVIFLEELHAENGQSPKEQ